ncbi:MAG: hypothetical protein HY898_15745 [Deltaproteobacteria bacterium]|nr:hypothetical protein [Deltaproteobacteria bacterium]
MSRDPIRLMEDPALSEGLRAALRQAAEQGAPGFDLGAGLDRFRQQLSAPTAPSAAPALGPKLILGLGGLGVIGAVVLAGFALRSPHRPPPSPPAVVVSQQPEIPQPPAPSATVEIDLDQEAATLDAGAPASSSAGPAASRSETKESRDDLYRREVQHLAEVRAALGRSPEEALRMADKGHREFARGMLYQEREALAIRALVRLGRAAQARARTEQFVARFPRSPYSEQLRRETGLSP